MSDGGLISRSFYERALKAISDVERTGLWNGAIVPLTPRMTSRPTPPIFPWQIYRADPVNPDGTPMTDDGTFWRTISVRSGTVSNFHPVSTGDDNISDDTDPILANRFLTLDENLHYAPVYLEVSIETDPNPEIGTQGDVTGVTILASQNGWENYPREPAGDNGTGAPPAKYYIPIGKVSTTQDGDPDDPESDDEQLTIHLPERNTNLILTMEGFGQILCTPQGLVTQQHLVEKPVSD